MPDDCPFCTLKYNRVVAETELTLTLRDGYPVSQGHTLIVPRRHVGSFFAVTSSEQKELMAALAQAKEDLDRESGPDSYNIGINDGPAAGQSIAHLHIHLIPRYSGDRQEPRGGVRWIFPEKADYWSKAKKRASEIKGV
jgi:diadenosine tetraphosphate (Ap4A) HIT family hydrolase